GERMDVTTWTPGRVERWTQLFEEGLPTAEIGRRLGLTKNAVIGKLHRIALAPRGGVPIAQPQRNFFEFAGPGCLWPHGHPDDAEFHFCGARPLPGKSYCAELAAGVYVRPKEPREENERGACAPGCS